MLADTVLLGLLVALVSLPVLTLPAAFAAACGVAARWRAGESPALWPAFRHTLRERLSRHLLAGAATLVVCVLLALNLQLLVALELPGGVVLRWLTGLLSLLLLALMALTAAFVGTTGDGWLVSTRRAYSHGVLRPGLLLLLGGALAAAGVLVWALPPLLLVVAGPLALAATSVSEAGEP
ncbi:putative membrane protein YesL [Crossiella equi]|uniref:Membrane protein YesL n=1 Tax=Crossiella equi TaxID=130796 RepID=A0ABS5AMW8_9PSEU|nr:DUF624 domain-containing protein [Crossiella equi]MBP2477914.1 putative membrane protein YesL [Crossiella equi]